MGVRPNRVLLTSSPGLGHFYPLVPLGRALHRQGNTVAVLGAASELREAVLAENWEFLPAGPGIEGVVGAAFQRYPEMAVADPRDAPFDQALVNLFADVRVELTLPDALVAGAWQPDLIVSEHADFVGPLLAAATATPLATLGFGPGHTAERLALANRAVAPYYAREGLPPPRYGGLYQGIYLDTCPPSLQEPFFPQPSKRQALRPEPHHQPRSSWRAPEFAGRTDRPRVLLTMGTLFGRHEVFSAALAGLADLDLNVLVTVGPAGNPADLAVDSSWVHVERFAPLDRALEQCALAIVHGGPGTMLAALARGIPLVMIPQGADQFINTDRAVSAGAAIAIHPSEFSSATLRQAVERIRNDASFGIAARRIRDEISAAMPSADTVAAELVA